MANNAKNKANQGARTSGSFASKMGRAGKSAIKHRKLFSKAVKKGGSMLLKLAKAGAAKIGAKVMIILILVVALLMLVFGAFMGEKEDSGLDVDIYDICVNGERITEDYMEDGMEWIPNCQKEIRTMLNSSHFSKEEITKKEENESESESTSVPETEASEKKLETNSSAESTAEPEETEDELSPKGVYQKCMASAFLLEEWASLGKTPFNTIIFGFHDEDYDGFVDCFTGDDFMAEDYKVTEDETWKNLENFDATSDFMDKYSLNENDLTTIVECAKIIYKRHYFTSGGSTNVTSDDIQWPVREEDIYSSGFTSFADGSDRFKNVWHLGFDFGVHEGSPVYAVFDGYFYWNFQHNQDGYAWIVSDDLVGIHNMTLKAYYNHMEKVVATHGTHVKKGDLIGYSGMGGGVYHLCFKITETDESTGSRTGYDSAQYFYPYSFFDLKDPQPLCRDKGDVNGCIPESYLNTSDLSEY